MESEMSKQTALTITTSPIMPVEWRGAGWNTLTVVEKDAHKDKRSRLAKYDAWLADQGQAWHNPDLAAYRDYLLTTLAPSTVGAHLSTIRARYDALLRDPAVRAELYTLAGAQLADLGQEDNPANRAALVNEQTRLIENAIKPKSAPVSVTKRQDEKATDHLRLTVAQANKLMKAPGLSSVKGVRDTALIVLALCTGLREAEIVNLDVADLRQRMTDGTLALEVRQGKGNKQRLVPYGELTECLAFVDKWLALAGIESGPVFRGLFRDGRLRAGRLTTRSVRKVMESYPVMIGGELRKVKAHDLRRTYARRLFDAGVGVVAIQQNMGHSDLKTTLAYVGILDADQRRPPAVYDFNNGLMGDLAQVGT
jgi:site-specific recombinase XerD